MLVVFVESAEYGYINIAVQTKSLSLGVGSFHFVCKRYIPFRLKKGGNSSGKVYR